MSKPPDVSRWQPRVPEWVAVSVSVWRAQRSVGFVCRIWSYDLNILGILSLNTGTWKSCTLSARSTWIKKQKANHFAVSLRIKIRCAQRKMFYTRNRSELWTFTVKVSLSYKKSICVRFYFQINQSQWQIHHIQIHIYLISIHIISYLNITDKTYIYIHIYVPYLQALVPHHHL